MNSSFETTHIIVLSVHVITCSCLLVLQIIIFGGNYAFDNTSMRFDTHCGYYSDVIIFCYRALVSISLTTKMAAISKDGHWHLRFETTGFWFWCILYGAICNNCWTMTAADLDIKPKHVHLLTYFDDHSACLHLLCFSGECMPGTIGTLYRIYIHIHMHSKCDMHTHTCSLPTVLSTTPSSQVSVSWCHKPCIWIMGVFAILFQPVGEGDDVASRKDWSGTTNSFLQASNGGSCLQHAQQLTLGMPIVCDAESLYTE